MILISEPIFDLDGIYRGVVDGTIYFQDESSLETTLNNHDFLDETTVFVIDRTGRIIYHPDSSQIDAHIDDYPLLEKVIDGESGSEIIKSSDGEEYFSADGYIEETGWSVVTQTPTSVIDEPLQKLRKEMIAITLPVIVIFLVLTWILAARMGKPLEQLSGYSRKAIKTKKIVPIYRNIKSAIFEIRELKKDIQKHLELLNAEVQLDSLTNINNRRTFNLKIQELIDDNKRIFINITRYRSF